LDRFGYRQQNIFVELSIKTQSIILLT
jgi:hypothetical protein